MQSIHPQLMLMSINSSRFKMHQHTPNPIQVVYTQYEAIRGSTNIGQLLAHQLSDLAHCLPPSQCTVSQDR